MAEDRNLTVIGARTHNLKGIDVELPKDKIVFFTGVSGSGKSSLVFDTIYTEAQRQLVETFSSFARRRLPKLSRPPVDEIRNLSTAIVIDQKRMGRTLRSNVGTATEIATYLRMLYSRFGEPFIGPSFYFSFNNPEGMCPECSGLGKKIRVNIDLLIDMSKSIKDGAITHPNFKIGGWMWRELMVMGLFDVEKKLSEYRPEELDKLLHTEPIPVVKAHGAGIYSKTFEGIARKLERAHLDKAEDEAPDEEKDAYLKYLNYGVCPSCRGKRVNPRAESVRLNGKSIVEICDLELVDFLPWLEGIRKEGSFVLVDKMRRIAGHLVDIGVGYLSLNRSVATLSGGESQRVKMARQLDCDLTGLLYILDEPSTGLHPKDNDRLFPMLVSLKEAGNSVFVVEHDPDLIRRADWIVDIGPKAGKDGGTLLYAGPPSGIPAAGNATGEALRGGARREVRPRRAWKELFMIRGARENNLKDVSVDIPKGVFTCVTGVAGSGKSSLIHDVFCRDHPEAVVVDQTAIGRTSRGTPASFIGVFDLIRKELARELGADAGLFSFNSKGACPKCGGSGYLAIELSFLDEVRMTCDECSGRRYGEEVLAMKYNGRDISEILEMTAEEAGDFFGTPEIRRRLKVLCDVGLDYIPIGQPLSTLSGGECQRLKLASELHKEGMIYVMDEPTSGLHPADTEKLLALIDSLVGNGNTVIVIEHNLDVMLRSDWIIDLGPGGGKEGGELLIAGPPEEVARCARSHTGRYLGEIYSLGALSKSERL